MMSREGAGLGYEGQALLWMGTEQVLGPFGLSKQGCQVTWTFGGVSIQRTDTRIYQNWTLVAHTCNPSYLSG
jgi:hypothetical protein